MFIVDQIHVKIRRQPVNIPRIFVKGDRHPLNLLMLAFLLHPLWWLLGIDQMVIAVTPFFVLMMALARRQIELRFYYLNLALGAFVLANVASGIVPLFEENRRFYSALYLYKTVCFFSGLATFIIVANASRSMDDILRIIKCLVLTVFLSVVATAIALPFYYSGWGGFETPLNWILPESAKSLGTIQRWLHKFIIREAPLFEMQVLRSKGLFLYSNLFGFSLETVIPFIIYFLTITKRKLFLLLVLVTSIIAFLLTVSRGGTLCLLAGLTFIFFLRVGSKSILTILFLTMFLSLFIFHYAGYKSWFSPQNLFKGGAEMVTGARIGATKARYMIYAETLRSIDEKPFFGWGTLRKFPGHPGWPYVGSHSTYLAFLMRTGIFGTCMFFWFFGCLYKRLWALYNEDFPDERGNGKMLSICLAGILVIHVFHMIVLNIQADLFTLNITLAAWGLIPALAAVKKN